MAATDFIVAIELGSTEITGIAGKKNADGSIQILAYASERSSDCIKKGAIYNLDKTTQSLTSVIRRLEEKLQASIKKVYVGIGGQSVRSLYNTETKQLGEDTKISQALIDSMMQDNREFPLIDQEILAVEPQEYKVGNNLLTEPVGIPADRIEGHFLNIIARHSLKGNIKQCFKQAGYEIADYFISPLMTANTVLTNSEKRSGCALVDFGADTTTVSVYKSNILRHLAVIPLGGSNITKDITSQQIEEEDAEQLKLRFASAFTEPSEDETETSKEYNLDGKCSIPAHLLEEIVEARTNEILTNVWNQIMTSQYGDKLLAGVILTGGASSMRNIDQAFTRITKIDKVRIAKAGDITLVGDIKLPKDGSQNTLIGILAAGKDNCCRIDPRGYQTNFIDEIQAKEQEARQKEEERKRKEEQERLERERQAREEAARREAEEAARRKEEKCTELIAKAKMQAENKKYNEAITALEEASALNIESKKEEISRLKDEFNKQKEENKWFNKWKKKFSQISEDMFEDPKN